jgi:protoporphyrin/coproporphyrin ferrochelatase
VRFDALLLVGFGGPEGPDDVLPFLENVTRGRGIPKERLLEVGAHYARFGGVSPINAQLRALKAAIEDDFRANDVGLPVYWGNRNWHPLLSATVTAMRDDGVKNALAFVTSAFGSYSGCRQYREDLERARGAVPGAPEIVKLRNFFDHPLFVEAVVERVKAALGSADADARLVFTAHSIPSSAASTAPYEAQLRAIAAIVSERTGRSEHDLVFQSRSGAPGVPWLEPDVEDHLAALHGRGVKSVVLVPLGFVSDHMEVIWDLDTQARATADRLGMRLTRAATVSTHPLFLEMIRELVRERTTGVPRRALTTLGDGTCHPGCCVAPTRPAARPAP